MALITLIRDIFKNIDAVRWFVKQWQDTPTEQRIELQRSIDAAFKSARSGDPRDLAWLINKWMRRR